jgi:hypothetical protein
VLNRLVRFCGMFAGRDKVSSRPLRVSITLVLSVVALLMLCGGVAGAAVSGLAADGNFHAEGASGIAIDQSSGDVFTSGMIGSNAEGLDLGRNEKFDAAGNVLSPPSPFGAEALHYGAALNPTNGHLYVVSPFGEIEIYDPNTGAELSSFSVPPFVTIFSAPEIYGSGVQIATDAAGDVYVPNIPENKVLKYSEAGTLLETITGTGAHALKRPRGIAVDSSGNLWVADNGHNRVEEFSSTGVFLDEFESEGVMALAVDGHGHVFAIVDNGADNCSAITPPCEHLLEYSEAGAQLADVGAGFYGPTTFVEAGATSLNESMVAVDDASGRVYVTDGSKDDVWVYQPPTAPVVGQESAAEVGTSEAKLGVLVQPGGIQTTYRFEYDTHEYKQGEGPHGVSVPYPEGSAGEGFSSRVVWASAKGLLPGTTYYYHAVATNGLGTVTGPDQSFTTATVAQATCPNETFRSGFSADLPECRAYELVTPPGESSAQPDTRTEHINDYEEENEYIGGLPDNLAASDGSRFAYEAAEVMPGSQSAGLEFVATRGPSGWTSEDALPLRPYTGNRCTFDLAAQTNVLKYSPDLTQALILDNKTVGGYSLEFAQSCRGENVEVVSNEPFEQNLLARDDEDGSYQLVNLTPAGVAPEPAELIAASADLNVVVFSERAKLTPEAQAGAVNLYEWREGAVHLVKLELPSGAPVSGSVAFLSADGSDLFFTANGNLYMRVDGQRTVQVDEARGGSGPGGGGGLTAISADGTQVFFIDEATSGLTSDTVAGSGMNLYRYDTSTDQLSDLTPVDNANAELTSISEDGSYVYFTSDGVQSGSQANQFGETAQAGQPNLYLDHKGTITFLMDAKLMMHPPAGGSTFAIAQNGAFLAFNSTSSLTDYDNNGDYEIYLYSAAANRFECASCNPSGEAPTNNGANVGDKGVVLGIVPHQVSDNGQVFFETNEALLPRDTNGQSDTYEFDYNSGLHLISPGVGSGPSVLLDASVSGDDVFFLTPQSLVPQDSFQEARKIYDARLDGGFPETALPPACTTADACRSAATPQPSIFGEPSSQTFSGAGDLVPSVTAVVKPRSLTREQKLTRALKACHREKNGRKRLTCEQQARKRYGARASGSKRSGKANTSKRGGK